MHDPFVRCLSHPGEPLGPNLGIPEPFRQPIGEDWHAQGQGEILEVLVGDRSLDAWRAVGNQLMGNLVSVHPYIGITFDGTLGSALIDHSLRLLRGERPSTADVRMTATSSPAGRGGIANTTWNSISSTRQQRRWCRLWDVVDSTWFNQACDMLLLFYREDPHRLIARDVALTVDVLVATIRSADAWLLPLDGNLGFLAGVPVNATPYPTLRASPPQL